MQTSTAWGQGGVSFEEQESFVDHGIQFSIKAPQDPSLYSRTDPQHVTFHKFYGTCVFLGTSTVSNSTMLSAMTRPRVV